MSGNPLIRKLLNFAPLSADEQSLLDKLMVNVRSLRRRQVILFDGDRPNHVHLILRGWAARYKDLRDGTRQIVAFLLPGDLSDLHAPILRQMDHGILTLTDAEVAYVPADAIDVLIGREPRIARALRWSTLVDEAVLRAWIVNNSRRDARARIAHLFCELRARMEVAELTDGNCFTLPLTQEEIGYACGISVVHANRTLQLLRADGLIELRGQTLTILDPDALTRFAGFDPSYLHLTAQ